MESNKIKEQEEYFKIKEQEEYLEKLRKERDNEDWHKRNAKHFAVLDLMEGMDYEQASRFLEELQQSLKRSCIVKFPETVDRNMYLGFLKKDELTVNAG